MKRPIFWLLLLGATLQHCAEEGQDLNPVTVQFTCLFTEQSPEGGRKQSDGPTTLRISLEDNDGNAVFTLKEIQLLKVGDAYITEPLELLQGYYRITDFLLVAGNQVLYATPKQDSPLAESVNSTLPHGLWVTKSSSLIVAMEVVDVTQKVPEDFGYASFFINVINVFDIAVFTAGEQGFSLTDAKVRILKNDEVVKLPTGLPAEWTTNSHTRRVSFPGNPEDTYLLEVEKEGYATYRKWFVPVELVASLNNLPLKVYLVPAVFTMQVNMIDRWGTGEFPFIIQLSGEENAVIGIDWGDGNVKEYIDGELGGDIEHNYPSTGSYQIKFSGDLKKIKTVLSSWGRGPISEINVQGLPELREITVALSGITPKVIDLTYNYKLETVWVAGARELEELILTGDASYKFISLVGAENLNSEDIDQIIESVYVSVRRTGISGGLFGFAATTLQVDAEVMLGPPSAASLEKLRVLRDVYHWDVSPNPL